MRQRGGGATRSYYSRHELQARASGGGIYGDYYIFAENWEPYSLKTGTYNLLGIWINGNSGEIKEIKTDKNIKVILEPNSHIPYTKRITKDSK